MSAPSTTASVEQQRQAAWLLFLSAPDEAVRRLLDLGPGNPLQTERGVGQSNLSLLLDYGAQLSERTDEVAVYQLEVALDLIDLCIKHGGDEHARSLPLAAVRATIRPVVRMTIISRMRASKHLTQPPSKLPYDGIQARTILEYLLLLSSEVINGQATFDPARELAMDYTPYLSPDDPLVRAWQTSSKISLSASSRSPIPVSPHLIALSNAMDAAHPLAGQPDTESPDRQKHQPPPPSTDPTSTTAPPPSNSNLTPQDLIALIAPSLLTTLQSAPEPPLGISSTFAHSTNQGQADASAYAGKVYSSHEFRNRETSMPSGLGSGSGLASGAASNINAGGSARNIAMPGGGAILSGGTRIGLDRDPRAPSQRYGPGRPGRVEGMAGYPTVQYAAYSGHAAPGYGAGVHGAQGGMAIAQGTGGVGAMSAYGAGEPGLTPTASAFVPGASRPASRHVDEWSR